jgi:hypothetical protein
MYSGTAYHNILMILARGNIRVLEGLFCEECAYILTVILVAALLHAE